MRVIIAGSRGITNYGTLLKAIRLSGWKITTVISGTARGVDKMGERWARENGVPIEQYPADWDRFGMAAGYRRNAEMAKMADAVLALWDGVSKGTTHMINLSKKNDLHVFIHRCD